MRLYKFIGIRYALETLAFRRLKISNPLETNDPFEMCPFQFALEDHRVAYRKALRSHSTNRGFISFSATYESPAMWANYSDNHQGICLGFEVNEYCNFTHRQSKFFDKVDYVEEFREFNFAAFLPGNVEVFQEEIDYAMKTKSRHWEYEAEYRIFSNIEESKTASEVNFLPFGTNLKLEEVILGQRCAIPLQDILRLTEMYPVQLFRAVPSTSKFALETTFLHSNLTKDYESIA